MDSYDKFEKLLKESKVSSMQDLQKQMFGYSDILKILNQHYQEIGFPTKGMVPFVRTTISGNNLKICICDNLFVPKLDKKKKYNADFGKDIFILEAKDKQEIQIKTIIHNGNILSFNYLLLEYSILPISKMKDINREIMTGSSQNVSFAILQEFLISQNILIDNQFDLVDKASLIAKAWFGSNAEQKAA